MNFEVSIFLALDRPGPKYDNRRANESDRRADYVPAIRRLTLDQPKPEKGSANIDAAIGGEGAPGRRAINKSEKPGEHRKRQYAWNDPDCRFVEPQPRPEGKATGDFAQGRKGIDDAGFNHWRFKSHERRQFSNDLSGKCG